MPRFSDKPTYDDTLSAYQIAFREDLARIVDELSLSRSMRVLDVPCGNGFYSRLLAAHLGPSGRLDAVDLCPAYLAAARSRLRGARSSSEVQEADAYHLPFPDESFDLVWCAQSFISLDDPLSALLEMKRVLAPGGTIAVLENDTFHHVLLPWPIALELPVQRATVLAARRRYGFATKLAPVRRLPSLFAKAGFHRFEKKTFASDRTAPWPADVRRFLESHVRELRQFIRGRLTPSAQLALRRFLDPRRADSLFGEHAMDLTCLNVLYRARRPGTAI